ncbi:MAG TPA: tripartite tricarboxylate transporter substrate binding protein [Burkholderiales bacterium]|nr:tripartite tricarboxylate transporter substrate binding protein [Burkholderiales bacterium]
MIRALIVLVSLLPALAWAQAWPGKPVRMVVPFAPGGVTDNTARLVAVKIQEAVGQPVLVENRPGAGGIVATEHVARSAPDGYTILMASAAPQTLLQFLQKTGYDGLRDFAPVTLVNTFPIVLMVHPSVPAHSVKELIALARAQPGKLNFAGAGGLTQFAGEIFKYMAGIDMVYIPYKGGAPAAAAAAAGDVQVTFANYSDALVHMKSGRLRPLGMTSARRFPQSPEVPTIAEAALPGYQVDSWNGLLYPAGTPAEIVNRVAAAVQQGFKDPELRRRMEEMGTTPVGDAPAEFRAFVQAETEKWGRFVKQSGIKVEQ